MSWLCVDCSYEFVVSLAGLKDVPEGAVCLSASQVLAFGQAAVRLERTHSRAEGRSLSRRKLYMSVVCLFTVVS